MIKDTLEICVCETFIVSTTELGSIKVVESFDYIGFDFASVKSEYMVYSSLPPTGLVSISNNKNLLAFSL